MLRLVILCFVIVGISAEGESCTSRDECGEGECCYREKIRINVGELDGSVGERAARVGERGASVDERDTSVDERDTSVDERKTKVGERDASVDERDASDLEQPSGRRPQRFQWVGVCKPYLLEGENCAGARQCCAPGTKCRPETKTRQRVDEIRSTPEGNQDPLRIRVDNFICRAIKTKTC